MDQEIIIVSGLPRSGTSLMMQMLDNGGIEAVIDNIRTADTDNPKGYYEFEQVKKIKQDTSWLPATRGKVFKMVSQLLYDLPMYERYRVIFMERDMDEMLLSQEKMLARLNKPAAPRAAIKRAFIAHLRKLREWVSTQPNIEVLYVSYNELVERPEGQAERVGAFLEGKADAASMARTVDPSLYRNRKSRPSSFPANRSRMARLERDRPPWVDRGNRTRAGLSPLLQQAAARRATRCACGHDRRAARGRRPPAVQPRLDLVAGGFEDGTQEKTSRCHTLRLGLQDGQSPTPHSKEIPMFRNLFGKKATRNPASARTTRFRAQYDAALKIAWP